MEDNTENSQSLPPGRVSTSELLQRRDPQAIEELLRRYRPLLRAIVAGEIDPNLRAKVDPSDLVQEACLEVAKSIEKINSTRSPQFLAYLKQIVMNKLHDVRRRFLISQKRNASLESKASVQQIVNHAELQDRQDALEDLINEELLDRTRLALSKLPLEVKKVLHMRFVRGMTYSEIGQKLERTEDDVRMLIKRWLSRVQQEVLPSPSS